MRCRLVVETLAGGGSASSYSCLALRDASAAFTIVTVILSAWSSREPMSLSAGVTLAASFT